MSTVYQQEPPTSGRVILKTNYGELQLDLWTQEAPRACRNFLQLCLEGYYDGTIFHRVIKNFMVQGGDPTGTGQGGQSIYGNKGGFIDEYHSRLRFSHRGILAMANTEPNTNQSQFFMTVDSCTWLDKKHTIFGKIEGPTLYNLLKISELPTENDMPICDPIPKIERVIVVENPFEDIVPRNLSLKDKFQSTKEKLLPPVPKLLQRATLKDTNLLSFDQEEDNYENVNVGQSKWSKNNKKMISSHDALVSDISLSKTTAISEEQLAKSKLKKQHADQAKESLIAKVAQGSNKHFKNTDSAVNELLKQQQLQRRQVVDVDKELKRLDRKEKREHISDEDDGDGDGTKRAIKRAALKIRGAKSSNKVYNKSRSRSSGSSSEEQFKEQTSDKLTMAQKQALVKTRDEYNNLRADLLQFKHTKIGTLLDEENFEVQVRMSPLDIQRQKFINQAKMTRGRENETLARLKDFTQKLKSNTVKDDEENWMNNSLKFHIDSQKAYDVNKQYQNRDNFESFVTGGDPNKKYANAYANVKRPDLGQDMVQSTNMEDIVSMNELMNLASKNVQEQ